MDGYYNPYYPYTPTPGGMQSYAPPPKQEKVPIVNGWNGANACQMAPDSSRLALDSSGSMIWLITTDSAGYKTITPYDISDHKENAPTQIPIPDFSAIETRLSRLEAFMNEFNTPTTSAVTVTQIQPAATAAE